MRMNKTLCYKGKITFLRNEEIDLSKQIDISAIEEFRYQ
jgi:hypothetical protein